MRELGADEIGEGGAAVVPLSRYSDTSPFWEGAAIENAGGTGICSTGFSARTSSGAIGMVTAQHCGANQNWQTPTVFGGPARAVGHSNAGSSSTDSMLITGCQYSAIVYRGDWSSNTGRQITFDRQRVDQSESLLLWWPVRRGVQRHRRSHQRGRP